MRKHVPNLFTFLNMFSGLIAVLMATTDRLVEAVFFAFLGIFFDFFDGFFARLFKVEGELGKQLDSMADLITSGLVPGLVMFQLILQATTGKWFMELSAETGSWDDLHEQYYYYLPFLGLLIPLASGLRLAKFNLDERQSQSFIGLPTPAFSIMVLSLPLILTYSDIPAATSLVGNVWVLIGLTLFGVVMLNAELPLFSLKFKNYGWAGNQIKYLFLGLTLLLLLWLKTLAIPLVILLYILLSILENAQNRKS